MLAPAQSSGNIYTLMAKQAFPRTQRLMVATAILGLVLSAVWAFATMEQICTEQTGSTLFSCAKFEPNYAGAAWQFAIGAAITALIVLVEGLALWVTKAPDEQA
jgi:hypothetical protein